METDFIKKGLWVLLSGFASFAISDGTGRSHTSAPARADEISFGAEQMKVTSAGWSINVLFNVE